jgi:hypothetical protein
VTAPDIGGDSHPLANVVASDSPSNSFDGSRKLMTENNLLAWLEFTMTMLQDPEIRAADAGRPDPHQYFVFLNFRNQDIF